MNTGDFSPFREKMTSAALSEAAINAFERNYNALVSQENGMIAEEEILPATKIPSITKIFSEMTTPDNSLLAQTVVIKLNGGLGTSMGLQKAKSLLKVKGNDTFLDLTVRQILSLRQSTGAKVRLLFMNSFSTSQDTLLHLAQYADQGLADPHEVELMQNKIPKIDAQTLTPVQWTTAPDLEWCPPGHGDLYPALLGSGWLDKLLAQGVKYAFISNSDNLGAVLDPRLLTWFAQTEAPFAMEVTRRTEADKKGGHLAVRKSDNQLILREVAQCPDQDLNDFQDITRHQYFNTNSLWIRLDSLAQALKNNGGVLPLPMIKNTKTVDPRDSSSPQVYQLETAMGAGIECFTEACAIEVPRTRFAPVKTTADLFALRSDAYVVTPESQVLLAEERQGTPPIVTLDSKLHKLVDSLDNLGTPSLLHVDKLTVTGDVRFADKLALSGTSTWTQTDTSTPLFVTHP